VEKPVSFEPRRLMRFQRFMPTPSMAVALTALFVALGGSGYGASQLQQSSGSAIAAKKKHKPVAACLTSTKALCSNLRAAVDAEIQSFLGVHRATLIGPEGLQGSQGLRGSQGLQGSQGATGSQGAQGNPGPGAIRFSLSSSTDIAKTQLATIDGLTLYASCQTSAPEVRISADFPAGVDMSWSYIKQTSTPVASWVSTVGGSAQSDHTLLDESDASSASGSGQLIYDDGTHEVTVNFAYNALGYNCRVHGAAVPAS
jgi:hypothetical protein